MDHEQVANRRRNRTHHLFRSTWALRAITKGFQSITATGSSLNPSPNHQQSRAKQTNCILVLPTVLLFHVNPARKTIDTFAACTAFPATPLLVRSPIVHVHSQQNVHCCLPEQYRHLPLRTHGPGKHHEQETSRSLRCCAGINTFALLSIR